MSGKRFVVRDAQDGYEKLNVLVDTKTGKKIGWDRMQVEDAYFDRDLRWVVDALNSLAVGNDPDGTPIDDPGCDLRTALVRTEGEPVTVVVSGDVADAFGMRGLPNTRIEKEPS